ncbi:mannose-1-phosphate guanylyltransferase [Fusibacter sp. JL216-2]|uniref:mannose-1-phosphate guanylyltransferase n=1 Tax=Fusibacter sp. JL216-2 TaxID=3071453 RepID=UPI003D3301CB
MKNIALIMAGGAGTRFWPMSRKSMPKQYLNLTGQDTLLNETIERLIGLYDIDDIHIVTNKDQETVLLETLPENFKRENLIFEPAMRNTSAAIGYSAVVLEKKYGHCVMSVFPADHHISDVEKFQKTIKLGIDAASENNSLVTFGLNPTYPATGYGYIRMEDKVITNGVGQVKEFVEKPDLTTAKKYIDHGSYFWNSGMFTWRSDVILEEFKRHLPELSSRLVSIAEDYSKNTVKKEYPLMEKVSIDYGILEKSDKVQVVPSYFEWNDVGTFEALDSIRESDENNNIIEGKALAIESKNTTVISKSKLIATVGLDNMIIIEEEDAILVLPKDRAQDVKTIVESFKKNNMEDYL